MNGNVNEWCWDKYGTGNTASAYRVSCGGSWAVSTSSSMISTRFSFSPNFRYNRLGFRVCRSFVI